MELLDRHRISFIDVEVDPIRFANDLLLRIRTNSDRLSNFFSSLHTDEATFSTSVAELRAFVARREAASVNTRRSIGLFAGQCWIDLSTVESGSIVKPAEKLKEISEIAKNVDTLLIKPHPFENEVEHLEILLDSIPNARLTFSNIYRILSDVNLQHVVALSSSVLDEAALFGVHATRLMEPDRDASALIPLSVSKWYRIAPEELTHEGFLNAFLGIDIPRFNAERRRLDLRRSLNTAWGFEDFYNLADLSLSIASHPASKFRSRRRSVCRAIQSMFRPTSSLADRAQT